MIALHICEISVCLFKLLFPENASLNFKQYLEVFDIHRKYYCFTGS